MKMQIGKWGNSLAVRFPHVLVEKYGIKEGDAIDIAALESLLEEAERLAVKERRRAAIKEIGERAFELPADWKFDREEANWRPAMDKW